MKFLEISSELARNSDIHNTNPTTEQTNTTDTKQIRAHKAQPAISKNTQKGKSTTSKNNGKSIKNNIKKSNNKADDNLMLNDKENLHPMVLRVRNSLLLLLPPLAIFSYLFLLAAVEALMMVYVFLYCKCKLQIHIVIVYYFAITGMVEVCWLCGCDACLRVLRVLRLRVLRVAYPYARSD
jgi:hypothetical protein